MHSRCFFVSDLPLGQGTIPVTIFPRIERVTSIDAAHALGIPMTGHWARKLAKEMRSRGWEPVPIRQDGQSRRGYQRCLN